ncbi:hypothetical protein ACCO45_004145 [Purpureocillium lilacinum]|uniref:Uncharacterized protein n=1 Tax=Purpureocillium lilacinum TaxID=33203 RepID=A0ACC4E2W1_PURLI
MQPGRANVRAGPVAAKRPSFAGGARLDGAAVPSSGLVVLVAPHVAQLDAPQCSAAAGAAGAAAAADLEGGGCCGAETSHLGLQADESLASARHLVRPSCRIYEYVPLDDRTLIGRVFWGSHGP